MEDRLLSGNSSSADTGIWTWIILAALLVLSVGIGVGALTLINATQQAQAPTGSQTAPSR